MRKIAISQRVVENETYKDRRDALSQDWTAAFADCLLYPVPNRDHELDAWMQGVEPHAVILTGGNNWGDAPERDNTECGLIDYAVSHALPVLGVCRGLQIINKRFGGSIDPDIKESAGASHTAVEHEVTIKGKVFQELAGSDLISVNSFHDQGVCLTGVSSELSVFATAGTCVEGILHPRHPILAVQWHPERQGPSTAFDFALIERFFEHGAFWEESDIHAG